MNGKRVGGQSIVTQGNGYAGQELLYADIWGLQLLRVSHKQNRWVGFYYLVNQPETHLWAEAFAIGTSDDHKPFFSQAHTEGGNPPEPLEFSYDQVLNRLGNRISCPPWLSRVYGCWMDGAQLNTEPLTPVQILITPAACTYHVWLPRIRLNCLG